LSRTYRDHYDRDRTLKEILFASGRIIRNVYDNGRLLVGAGAFGIERDLGNGLPTRVFTSGYELDGGFNGYGEQDLEEVRFNGQPASTWDLGRDNAGRITSKTETVGG
jgi:hypothetical protein